MKEIDYKKINNTIFKISEMFKEENTTLTEAGRILQILNNNMEVQCHSLSNEYSNNNNFELQDSIVQSYKIKKD